MHEYWQQVRRDAREAMGNLRCSVHPGRFGEVRRRHHQPVVFAVRLKSSPILSVFTFFQFAPIHENFHQ